VTGAETLVNLDSAQHLDSLSLIGGTVRLTPGGHKVLSLNSMTFAAPPPDVTSVPEPSTALLCFGALSVLAIAWRGLSSGQRAWLRFRRARAAA
jgi:hypothetical protein